MASFFCSTKFFFIVVILSAIPLAILVSLESATPTTHYYQFHSTGWFREASKWDQVNKRFIVSFTDTGGLGVVHVPDDDHNHSNNNVVVLEEIPVVKNNVDAVGNGTCGLFIDLPRNRVVVAIADLFGNKYSAVAAYDLDSWQRLFFTQLSNPEHRVKMPEAGVLIANRFGVIVHSLSMSGSLTFSHFGVIQKRVNLTELLQLF